MKTEAARSNLFHTLNRLIADDDSIGLAVLRARAHALSELMQFGLSHDEIEQVIADIIELRKVELRLGVAVVENDFVPWLQSRKAEAELSRWGAYRELLLQRRWAPNVVNNLDRQTDELLDLMGDPQADGPWSRRGLAIGEVQSGKTATYIGVLNKAIDYGYNIVVIIGGHTEDLRRQTQSRVDADLLGFDSAFYEDHIVEQKKQAIGIGKIDASAHTNVLTTTSSDFSSSAKRAGRVAVGGGVPTVFVVKKNAAVLRNLASYLKQQHHSGRLSVPLVVVDDEADWASINTRGEDDIAAVNKAIRDVLNASSRHTYLAITATPFANVLIDDANEGDLFPRDYIQALESPSDYAGIVRYFGDGETDATDSAALIDDVGDCLAMLPYSHKRTHLVVELPESMKDAIATFMVGVAVRRLRDGRLDPASMMVNVSRFNDIQARLSGLVTSFVLDTSDAIRAEFGLPEGNGYSPLTARLRRAFESQYGGVGVSWSDVRARLIDIALEMKIELVNGLTTKDRARRRAEMTPAVREAEDARPTIYVGGNVLARGLTLDGLQVSYFVRRAGAADTLLQMGRWFGYRPGYADLVRIWIDSTVVDLFRYVAEISDDLRRSMRQMKAMGLTPKHFGIKIRKHPEAFMVTAAAKQRAGEDFNGEVLVHGHKYESVALPVDEERLAQNSEAAVRLVAAATGWGSPERTVTGRAGAQGNTIWRGLPREMVEDFFTDFRGHESDPWLGPGPQTKGAPQIASYLSEAVNGETWDLLLVNGSGEKRELVPGVEQATSDRNQLGLNDGRLYFANRRVASAGDVRSILSRDRMVWLEAQLERDERLSETIVIKRGLERPALVLYAVTTRQRPESKQIPIAAVVVAFPGLSAEEEARALRENVGAKFVVNRVFARAHLGLGDEAEFAEEDQ